MGIDIRTRKALISLIFALLFAALTALLLFEAHRRGFSWLRFRQVVRGLAWPWLLAGCIVALLTYVVRAFRWRVLLRPVRPHPDFGGLLSATLIGFAVVSIIGRPGELVRPYLIAKNQQVPFSSQMAAWIVDRVYDLLVALLIFGFALSQVGRESGTMAPGPALTWVLRTGGWITLASCVGCVLVLIAIRKLSAGSRKSFMRRLGFLSPGMLLRIESLLGALLQGAASTRSTAAVLEIVAWSFAEWVLIAGSYACIVRSFGSLVHFNWLDTITFMGFVSFGSLLQIPGIGGGMQMTAVVVLTEIFALPLETATTLAMLIWLITSTLIAPVGAIAAAIEGLTWAGLREARRAADSSVLPNPTKIQEPAAL